MELQSIAMVSSFLLQRFEREPIATSVEELHSVQLQCLPPVGVPLPEVCLSFSDTTVFGQIMSTYESKDIPQTHCFAPSGFLVEERQNAGCQEFGWLYHHERGKFDN